MVRPLRLDAPTVGSMRGRAVLSTIGIGLQGGLRFLSSVAIGRIGGDAVLGVVNSAISAAMFLTLLGPQSAATAASKFVARARGSGDEVEVHLVARHLSGRLTALALALAVVGVVGWSGVSGEPLSTSWPGGLCVAAFVLGYSGYSFVRGLQFGAGQVSRATAWDVVSVAIGLTGLLILLAVGVRRTALLLPFAVAYGTYTVANWPRRSRSTGLNGHLSPQLRRELDHFVLLGVAGAVAVTGFLQLSMVVARLVDSDAQAGQYAAALALATPASLLAGSLSLVLFPAMSEAWGRGDHDSFRRQGDHAMRLLVLLMVAVFGALVLVSRPLVRIVYGGHFSHAASLLPWLLFAVLAISVGVGAVTSLTTRSSRGVTLSSASSAAGLLLGVLVWVLVAPTHGVLGVAIGYLAGTLAGTAVPVVIVWRQDAQRWAALMMRAGLGVALVLGLLWLEHRFGASPFARAETSARLSAWWLDPVCAVGFVVAWVGLSWPDMRRLVPPLIRR